MDRVLQNSNFRQIVSLVKIRAFHQNPALTEDRQREIRDQCLYNWKVPNDVRKAPAFEEPHVSFSSNLTRDLQGGVSD